MILLLGPLGALHGIIGTMNFRLHIINEKKKRKTVVVGVLAVIQCLKKGSDWSDSLLGFQQTLNNQSKRASNTGKSNR